MDFFWRPMYKNKDFLYKELAVNGQSPTYIASKIGCSRGTVTNFAKKFNLSSHITKEVEFKDNVRGSPPYGKKKIKGVLVDHLGERRVIKRILSLRKEGLSYQKIARYLTGAGVPTKKGRGAWQASTVLKIVKNYERIEKCNK